MLSEINVREERKPEAPATKAAAPEARPDDEAERAARRRQMYERIARGNALAEAEEAAQRRWRGR